MTIQTYPYLRAQREFPNENVKLLSLENDRAYIDIAAKVNDRTIGIFPVNVNAVTGEQWYLHGSSQKRQTLRQVYTFTSTASISHGISVITTDQFFTRMYGQFTDGTNWYGLFSASSTAIAGQITFYVTPTQIVFVSGAGAPSLTLGNIVLEWLSV